MVLVPVGRRADEVSIDKCVDIVGPNDLLDPVCGCQEPDKAPQDGQPEKVVQTACRAELAPRRGAASRFDGVEMLGGLVAQVPEFAVSNLCGSM